MRKLIVFVMILGMAANSFAVVKTPINKKPVRHRHESQETKTRIGWYLAPVLKIGEIRGEIRPMIGIRGGIEINRSFYVGIAGYGLPRPVSGGARPLNHYNQYDHSNEWDLGYGGLEFGVIVGSPKNGQLSLGALVGGGATNDDYDHNIGYNAGYNSGSQSDYHHEHGFFVFEPQLELSASVSRNVRVSVGGSYRFVDYAKKSYGSDDNLEGPAFNVAIAFGIF